MSSAKRAARPDLSGGNEPGTDARRRFLPRRRTLSQVLATSLSVALTGLVVAGGPMPAQAATDSDFEVDRQDLEFILKQIQIAENHTITGKLLCDDPADTSWTCVPNPRLPYGLRTVDGSYNNITPEAKPGEKPRHLWGSARQLMPRLFPGDFKDAQNLSFDPDGPGGPAQAGTPSSYKQKRGFVDDSEPRVVSNLIADQTEGNPAAVSTMQNVPGGRPIDHDNDPETPDLLFIPNTAPDEGLSAPFNSWFTLFGQFFDHGLDLVEKGGSGTVAVPLKADDPLYNPASPRTNFIFLTRATNQAGPDNILGTDDDVQEHINRTTPFVDQNQTYTSHPSHQAFLREYALNDEGHPVPTGRLLNGAGGGLATWADVKAQARDVLGIELDDHDVHAVPLLLTDPYGRFIPGPNGLPQLVIPGDGAPTYIEGDVAAPVDATPSLDAGHAFLDDIAHPATPKVTPDEDDVAGEPLATLPTGVYDDELLDAHFMTGDGRGNENIGLTAIHHVFHSEHNRVMNHIDDVINAQDQAFIDRWTAELGPWDYGERLFQAARYVTEMQYQHLVFEEFARKISPNIDAGPLNESLYDANIDPAIVAEFAHVVYRFGHSMLTDTVDRTGYGAEGMTLIDAFLNPKAFTDNGTEDGMTPDEGAAAVAMGMMNQTGSGIDEFLVEALRNNLLGLPLDLATLNLARARETGVPPLQAARRLFFEATGDATLEPYDSWEDFRLSLKHRDSIVNFVAAYGVHPTLASATTVAEKRAAAEILVQDLEFMEAPAADTGVERIDFWMGGLAERPFIFGSMLGSTFNAVFEAQLENLQNADRFYYLNRNQGLNLFHQLEANSLSEIVMRNTSATNLPADAFASQDLTVDLNNLPDPLPEGLRLFGTEWRYDGGEHITIHGTEENDRITGGEGDDGIWSHGGNDVIKGGDGNDTHHGGPGDDIMSDDFGDDVIHGGSGNDSVNAGLGLDILFGQSGSDFLFHGQDPTTSFAGQGPDFVLGGNAGDVIAGNEDHDWLEGGGGTDLVQGDNALTFQNDPVGGSEVLIGGLGNDDHDAEGGNDIMLNRGVDRHAGMLGFDWVSFKGDPDVVNADLDITVFLPPNVQLLKSRHQGVEGMSGWHNDDILRGASRPADATLAGGAGHELTQRALDEITGLRELLGGGETPVYAAPFLATNDANNIVLGGGGSDLLEGKQGDDFLDGDAALDTFLSGPGGERADSLAAFRVRLLSGAINPGELRLNREIVEVADGVDTAVFADVRDNYAILDNADGTWTVEHVDGNEGPLATGTDVIRNIERLQFLDQVVDLADLVNFAPEGTLETSSTTPVEDEQLTVVDNVTDADGIEPGTIAYTWQFGSDADGWTTAAGSDGGPDFTPGDAEVGSQLRVVLTYTDGDGVIEQVVSAPTEPVTNVNDAPTGLVVTPEDPTVDVVLTASGLVDDDGLTQANGDPVALSYQWQRGNGGDFTDIGGATDATYTAADADEGSQLRVRVSYTDARGTAETAVSAATQAVPERFAPDAPLGLTVEVGFSEVGLSWTPGADGGAPITGFEVRVTEDGQTPTIRTFGPLETLVTVGGLTPETPHTFEVRAINAKGASPWSDVTAAVEPLDANAAAVVAMTPQPGMTGVPTDQVVSVEFSKRVTGVNGTSMTLSSPNGPVPATVSYNDATRVATLTPSAPLANLTEYTVALTDGIRDRSNNPLTATSWSFTTIEAPAPQVTLRSPAPGATGVSRTANVLVTFDRPVTGTNTSSVQLRRVHTGELIPATVSYSATNRRVTLNPGPVLQPGELFEVSLSDAIMDTAGIRLVPETWQFRTTGTADLVAPTVTSRNPAPGATAVLRGANVIVTFSENVQGVSNTSFLLRRANGTIVPATVSYATNTRTATLNPSNQLPGNVQLTVFLTSTIRDASNNRLTPESWTFTTRN